MGMLSLAQVSQEELQSKILHAWEEGQHAWEIPLQIFGIDISLNKPVWFLFAGAAITFFIMFFGARALRDRPGAYQVLVEEIYGFGRNFLGGQIGEEGRRWMPYTLSIFIFLLTLNLIGLIPNSYPVTSNISFTLTLALATFVITQYQGVKHHGVGTYLGNLVPSGMPAKPIMVPFIFTIELIQEFTKPLTLGLRLYANILAGHLLIFVFLGLILYFGLPSVVALGPLALVIYAFEVFVAVIQAYIFAILTQVYIELAMFSGEAH